MNEKRVATMNEAGHMIHTMIAPMCTKKSRKNTETESTEVCFVCHYMQSAFRSTLGNLGTGKIKGYSSYDCDKHTMSDIV